MITEQAILSLVQQHGIPLVALIVLVGELGVPTILPVEIALLVVGGTSIHSFPALLSGLFLVVAADLIGTTLLYTVARSGGVRLLTRLAPRLVEASDGGVMTHWRQRLGNRDVAVVFVTRILPLVRMWATISAGLLRFRVRDFLSGAAPAAVVWAGTPLVIGYLFRDQVTNLTARFTSASHLLTLIVPVMVVVAVVAWWVWRGHVLRARIRRGRSALGIGAAVVGLVFLARTVLATDHALDQGNATFSYPLLLLWLIILITLSASLLVVAFADLRTARGSEPHVPVSRLLLREIGATLVWATLVALGAGIISVLELRYPII